MNRGLAPCALCSALARVLPQAHDVVDVVALAPRQLPIAAESRIAAEHQVHSGPRPAQAAREQLHDRRRVQRRIVLGRTQVRHQQLLAAEHVQRQEGVAVVVRAEVPFVLLAMHRIVGGIEVQDQFLWRLGQRGDELLDQHAMQIDHRLAVGARFEAAQGRARRAVLVRGRLAALVQRRLQRRVQAQLIVVVQVFVALAQPEHPLPQQLLGRMHDQVRIARIRQHLRRRLEQTQLAFRLSQQQAGIGTDLAAVETHLDAPASQHSKQLSFLGTIWHRR